MAATASISGKDEGVDVKKSRRPSKIKGDLLEEVVAALHEGPSWSVEKKARVHVRGDTKDTREIDVLISGSVAGYPVRFAIECKNWSKKIESPDVEAFGGKLDDIGIPRSHGIYVAASGYTKGALRRAAKEGIQTLEFMGLSKDRLQSAVEKAFRHTVYLLPEVESVNAFDDREPSGKVIKSLRHKDPDSGASLYVLDHLWKKWFFGECPKGLGLQHHRFQIPQDPALFGPGEEVIPRTIYLGLRVRAAVVSTEGGLTHHALRNASTRTIERQRVFMDFGQSTKHVVQLLDAEEELEAFLQANTTPSLTIGRFPLPRIIYQAFYWPPTPSALQKAVELRRQGLTVDFESVEGPDLTRAWEFLARPEDFERIRDDLVNYRMYP